ncbi:MAG TPA: hypothetical protein VFY60_11370 [Pyrinomonadaceae bacterium]|nr:hypothetical protein [Pyrinomonadaceae bacterium]
MLLKLLQFPAPYPGYYLHTAVNTNGNAFTLRRVPNWADQSSSSKRAQLNDAVLLQIKQLLAEIKVPYTPAVFEPLPGHLHSIFVFHNGREFVQWNYNGPNPPQIAAILAILQKEFMANAEAEHEKIAAHQKRIRETYGDWENRPGITLNAGSAMHLCKGNRAVVVWTAGMRKPVATSPPVVVSAYHALIFYPEGTLSSTGSGGRWSDDPVQSYVAIWTLRNSDGTFSAESPQRKLEILHNAIDTTVTIAGKTYQLTAGNMFVIRMGADWLPTVSQLDEVFAEQATPHKSLDRFKAVLKADADIQKLELY